MNSYFDYTDDISASELYDSLVGHGLFAEKIPNFLTSEAFLHYAKTLTFPFGDKPKDYIRYSNMRNINIPRPLAIPEPFAYANQCKILSNNWPNIQLHFQVHTKDDVYKISRIHLRKMKDKPFLFEMNYKNIFKDGDPEQDIIIKSRYIACADISNCFPSIYSHSITWALVSKTHAKRNKSPSNWFNQIDFYTRNVKFGETNGILIGPHSSSLISEIILVSIDNRLSLQGYKYVRFIDDYTCYVETYEEADRFFIALSEELKAYELVLNNKKSRIIPLPQASVKNWLTKLNHFNFTNIYWVNKKEAIRVKELKAFLDFAIELMLEENGDASVLNYAIKIISNKHLDKNAKEYYLKQIHHLVLLYPYLISVLEDAVFEPHSIDKQHIKSIAMDIYEIGIRKKMFEPCSFAVYWALKFDFKIDISTLKVDSLTSMDCIFMLISYLYDKKYYTRLYLKEYKDQAKLLKRDEFDRYWLFIYEILSWPDLIDHFKIMKKNGLTFIRPGFN